MGLAVFVHARLPEENQKSSPPGATMITTGWAAAQTLIAVGLAEGEPRCSALDADPWQVALDLVAHPPGERQLPGGPNMEGSPPQFLPRGKGVPRSPAGCSAGCSAGATFAPAVLALSDTRHPPALPGRAPDRQPARWCSLAAETWSRRRLCFERWRSTYVQ